MSFKRQLSTAAGLEADNRAQVSIRNLYLPIHI